MAGTPGWGHLPDLSFHVDWTTPANTTFTSFATPPAAAFTQLCTSTRACVPQTGVKASSYLDAIADRPMFGLAYRNFGDHESVVGNFTVSSGGVAGIRWFELRGVTAGPVTVYQQSTYQPDSTWRSMGSAAMDQAGNMAFGFSASSGAIHPQIRYAGRLAGDPLNTMAQVEATIFAGTGSQTGTSNRWGDYSAMTVDPVDDCTFWYTTEYYSTTTSFNWRTRIGSFKFTQCGGAATVPGAPTLTSTTRGNAQVALAWMAPVSSGGSVITGYRVYRGTTSANKVLVATLGNVTSYTNTGLAAGTYLYQVSAVNAVGEGLRSNELSATVTAAPCTDGNRTTRASRASASPRSSGSTLGFLVATDVDHIVTKRNGGTDDQFNLRSLCHACHSRRTLRDSVWH